MGLKFLTAEEQQVLRPYLHTVSGSEIKAFCPICEDPGTSKSPSASINSAKGVWRCFKSECHTKVGGSITALTRFLQRDDNVVDIFTRGPVKDRNIDIPSMKQVRFWHKVLMADEGLLRQFKEKRGLKRKTIREAKIGWHAKLRRYTIPIFDAEGNIIAVKGYRMQTRDSRNKMIFIPGGHTTLYNIHALKDAEEICVVEGELDSWTLIERGIPAVGHTGGAGGWKPEWAREFTGKRVYVIADEDPAGIEGAQKIIDSMRGIASELYLVEFGTGHPHTDATDFLVELGFTIKDFRKRMAVARERPLHESSPEPIPQRGRKVTLQDSQSANSGIIELDAQVVGRKVPPYLVPKNGDAVCTRAKGPRCKRCPMFRMGGSRGFSIRPDDPIVLEFLDTPADTGRQKTLVRMIGALCDDQITFKVTDEQPVEVIFVSQSVENRDPGTTLTPLVRQVYSAGTYHTDTNTLARIVAKHIPHPKSQEGTLLSWKIDPVRWDLDDFEMTPEIAKELRVFRPEPRQTSIDKCREIADSMSSSVTRIYGRTTLHMAMDLVWHSVLAFDLMKQHVHKGWLECLVIGDTRTGKSEVAHSLERHYQLGVVRSCEGATLAGLVGGAQQMGSSKTWTVTWGLIPLNDRRLVVLDEMSGLMVNNSSKGIIEAMSSIRSEGIAELTKIVNQRTSARTRLIWISNPVDGKPLAESNGIAAIPKLVVNPEDIARFDFALSAANEDVSSTIINRVRNQPADPKYGSDLCHKLILWAWSRRPEHVVWSEGAEKKLVAEARKLGGTYISDPPLVQPANIRVKLARIAVAMAARTFSTDQSGQKLIVTSEHISSAVQFLHECYGNEAMGYLTRSRARRRDWSAADSHKNEVRTWLRKNPDVLEALYAVSDDKFRPQDFEGLRSIDPMSCINKLREWRMIRRIDRGFYIKEPLLISLLRRMEDQ